MKTEFEEISAILAAQTDAKRIARLLEELFTPAELKDLAARWKIVKMLKAGIPQRKIAAELHVSLCKITRGSKELKKPKSELKEALKKLNK